MSDPVDMTLEDAARLFDEARAFWSGRQPYVGLGSEIRQRALARFGEQQVQHLKAVCEDVFYLLACELRDVPP